MLGMTPYYAVIFTSTRTDGDNGYSKMADEMEKLAKQQPGYIGIESARGNVGITVLLGKSGSYCQLESQYRPSLRTMERKKFMKG